MDSKRKFVKKWGADYHFFCSSDGELPLVNLLRRGTIFQKIHLSISDRLYKDHQYPTTISYCNGCIAFVEKTCTECKQNCVSIREINVQTSYETKSGASKLSNGTSQWTRTLLLTRWYKIVIQCLSTRTGGKARGIPPRTGVQAII